VSWPLIASLAPAALLAHVGTAAPLPRADADHPPARAQGEAVRRDEERLAELVAVRRLYRTLARQRESPDEGERAAAWADLSVLIDAIAGERRSDRGADGDLRSRVPVTPAVAARDRAAYQLLALGYSSRETADIVSGRISRRALDTARKMLMVGRGADAAANYLDSQYRPPVERAAIVAGVETDGVQSPLDGLIERYAGVHHVDAALVRAIVAVESAFDPRARSRVGAVGLMQLMPATARELGVDPALPDQNIEGGVRYLSALLKMFGGVELALVAYNGGPGFARRYARGQTALYGETRDYVKRVLARLR
jgi:soluble lytic murein transglycosylase-like protein